MKVTFRDRLSSAWNVFTNPVDASSVHTTLTTPATTRYRPIGSMNIVQTMYNKIAIDVSNIAIRHVKVDELGRYSSEYDSSLNRCLTLMANKDQTGAAFMYELVYTMLEEGAAAIVPVDTSTDIFKCPMPGSYEILSMRVGRVVEWYTDSVRLNVYNDRTGQRQDILLPKDVVCIINSPLYEVTSRNGGMTARLNRKLDVLDSFDNSALGKRLDLIIQLPYAVRGEMRKEQAEVRRNAIEDQLRNSEVGVAYVDGAEKITQLNRPVENNLLDQIKYLTEYLYNMLGFTESVFDGTAEPNVMLSYYNRTIRPILNAITTTMTYTFLTQKGQTMGQRIIYVRDPFASVSLDSVASMAQTFVTNMIMSPNEIRSIIGLPQSDDPNADKLANPYTTSADSGEDGAPTDEEDEGGASIDDLL